MSIAFVKGFNGGIDSESIAANQGLASPSLTSASSTESGLVRIVFDRAMNAKTVEDRRNYSIKENVSGKKLFVVSVLHVSDTSVDLVTSFQANVIYDVAVTDVTDSYGNKINTSASSTTFTGTLPSSKYTNDPARFDTFQGHYSGLETNDASSGLPDTNPPILDSQNPPSGSSGVDKDTNIYFRIYDADPGTDLSTISVEVNGATAYTSASGFIAPFDGPASDLTIGGGAVPPGVHITVDKTSSYASFETIDVHVVAKDLYGNTLDTTYSFGIEDYEVPTIDSNLPTGSGVSAGSNISFSTHDSSGSGINQATINADVTIDLSTESAIINGVLQSGWDGPSSAITPDGSGGFDVVIDPTSDFGSFKDVQVDASCEDNNSNAASLSWAFKTEDLFGPLVVPINPTAGQAAVSSVTNIQIRLEDDDSSIFVLSTLLVRVDRGDGSGFQTAFDSVSPRFKSGWDGPGSTYTTSSGYLTITIDPVAPFNGGDTVVVEVTANDSSGNSERI